MGLLTGPAEPNVATGKPLHPGTLQWGTTVYSFVPSVRCNLALPVLFLGSHEHKERHHELWIVNIVIKGFANDLVLCSCTLHRCGNSLAEKLVKAAQVLGGLVKRQPGTMCVTCFETSILSQLPVEVFQVTWGCIKHIIEDAIIRRKTLYVHLVEIRLSVILGLRLLLVLSMKCQKFSRAFP